ncbi:ribonuclease P protein component [Alkaliphilus serpentinus]|uniref:Ribonuclease P protein component n=1 Tax=Alkaliphilus serpentinus TaxID=1482731 RepID=A0A833HQY9_9FIRM|nr:ribonuclease P protein component [Alkaliphilus serpentinus]KAB3532220.1 ribonuclease P protein component [Alkaliphilus serpentinus]
MESNNKLRKNEDFRKVYKYGKSMANKLLIVYYLTNNTNDNRIGFTVSKKVGKSVVRSRVKRLMKEAYRLNDHKVKLGYDIVFIARQECNTSTYAEIESAILHLLKRIKLLK